MEIKLDDSKVYRGGVTAPSMSYETSQLAIGARPPSKVRVSFKMSSKGGGVSRVWVELGGQDFPAMLGKMLEADRHAAMQAMATAVLGAVSRQPSHDEAIANQAMEAVRAAAQDQYTAAPADNDHAERFILESVTALIKKIRDGKGQAPTKAA